MPRSFAWAVGWRVTAALLIAAATWHWLGKPWEQAVTGLGFAAAVAVSSARALRQQLSSLERNVREAWTPEAVAPAETIETNGGRATGNELRPLESALREAHLRAQQYEAAGSAERRKLQSILDSLPEAIAALDSGERMQWMNSAMQRLLPEATANRPLQNRLGQALVHIVRDPDVLQAASAALAGEPPLERRARTVLPGRVFEVNAAPMPQGGAVVVLRDITRAEGMERTQRDFVANVSHELRTPLTSITGYVETLLEDFAQPADPAVTTADSRVQIEFLATVLRNAERMNLLIDDLLELSRVESGEHRVHPTPVPAAELIEEALAATAGLVSEQGRARIERGELVSWPVLADHDATVRVLTNLLENALKYGRGAAETRVVVSAGPSIRNAGTPGREMVCFSVRDFGPGIASEHQPRLFERFYRVDKARSRETGGTGLGLAIARGLVNAQGGEIWCESERGRGSDFRFILPLAPETAALEEDEA